MTWPPSWIAMVKRGLMSQASPNELRVSRISYFHNNYAQEQREKTPRRKAILRGKFQQLERQHNTQKGLLLPSFLSGGGTQQTFMREGAAPRLSSTPYLFNTIVDEKVTPFVYLLLTNGTPFTYMYTLFRTLHSF